MNQKKLKAEFNSACQIDETSNDGTASSTNNNTPSQSELRTGGNGDADEDEDTDDDLVQFNFDESINAKKKALNGDTLVASLSSNALAAQARITGSSDASPSQPQQQQKQESASNVQPQQNEANLDECDKEKMEAIKNKQKQTFAFDMFADDEEYETVSRIDLTKLNINIRYIYIFFKNK